MEGRKKRKGEKAKDWRKKERIPNIELNRKNTMDDEKRIIKA